MKELIKTAIRKLPASIQGRMLSQICQHNKIYPLMRYRDDTIIIAPLDGVIDILFFTRAYHEEVEVNFVRRQYQGDGDVIDIGANVGFWTLPLSKMSTDAGKLVHGFEPTPSTFRMLRWNCYINDLQNVRLYPYGLSDSEELLQMGTFDEHGSIGWNTFALRKSLDCDRSQRPDGFVQARVRRLDDWWIESGKAECGFAKIDVEGFELKVLEGGREFFSHHARKGGFFMLVEVNSKALRAAGYSAPALMGKLWEFGFEVFRFSRKGPLRRCRMEDLPEEVSENVIVAAPGKAWRS